MPRTRVIRIDEQVWAELQKLAQPLEDTPNSVLRRVFGLGEQESGAEGVDSRISELLEMVEELIGETPQIEPAQKNFSFLSQGREVVAYIRPQQQRLRVGVRKETAVQAGLSGWDRERKDGFFDDVGVRWHIPDGDISAYRQAAGMLSKLWRIDSPAEASTSGTSL